MKELELVEILKANRSKWRRLFSEIDLTVFGISDVR